MAYPKTKTAVGVAVVAALPILLQWNENRKLHEELARAEGARAGGSARSERGGGADKHSSRRSMGAGPVQRPDGATAWTPQTSGATDWKRALAEQDPVKRSQQISQLLADFDLNSAAGIAELFFGDGVEGTFETEAGLFLRAWAQKDGAAAIAFLETRDQAKSASSFMLAALGGWASKDHQAALAWAEGVEDGNLREDLLFGVIDGWSLTEFNAAADYAETRPRSGARTRFVDLLFQRSLAAGGIAGAQQWFEGISQDEHNVIYRRRAFERVAAAMVGRDPSAAAQWIAGLTGEIPVSRETVESAAKGLAETSPERALQWISSLGTLGEGVADASLGSVFSDWAENHLEAAGTWLGDHQDHPGYATMARNYSAKIAHHDTVAAVDWARSIQDDGQRQAAAAGVAERRFRADGDAAIDELRLAGLTEDEISRGKEATQARMVRGITFSNGGNGQFHFQMGSGE